MSDDNSTSTAAEFDVSTPPELAIVESPTPPALRDDQNLPSAMDNLVGYVENFEYPVLSDAAIKQKRTLENRALSLTYELCKNVTEARIQILSNFFNIQQSRLRDYFKYKLKNYPPPLNPGSVFCRVCEEDVTDNVDHAFDPEHLDRLKQFVGL
uniref:Homeobox domain-containing protein n=1 Tax=Panagrellus redivivus TaxID=6233 RepID=A0A7E4VDD6_PANRE